MSTAIQVTILTGGFDRPYAFGLTTALAAQGVALRDLDFDALDAMWDAAKAEERTR